jgi:peptide-methionine (S)-S-oxide reductase
MLNRRALLGRVLSISGLALGWAALVSGAADFPAAAVDIPEAANRPAVAIFAGGCFLGMEAVFEQLKGVSDVVSGYAGGDPSTAHYEMVGAGRTGHAESVQITYDPSLISYGKLLQVYFSVAHDPTQLNRQGPDQGTQYRSAIFYASAGQKRVAEAYIRQLTAAKIFRYPIVTQVAPLTGFFEAEEYHQGFIANHPDNPYVVDNDLPKIERLRRVYPELLKPR